MREGPKADKCFGWVDIYRRAPLWWTIAARCSSSMLSLATGHSIFKERWLAIADRIIHLSNTQKFSCYLGRRAGCVVTGKRTASPACSDEDRLRAREWFEDVLRDSRQWRAAC